MYQLLSSRNLSESNRQQQPKRSQRSANKDSTNAAVTEGKDLCFFLVCYGEVR